MNFEDMKSPELQERLRSAKTIEELTELLKAEGVALADEQLEAFAGGKEWYEPGTGCPGQMIP